MNIETWSKVLNESFWSGVLASILAAAIVGIIVYTFRNSLSIFRQQRERGRKENELFESALQSSSPYAPFAFGIVQGRALRYFLTAVFSAYVGDIVGALYPFNLILYVFSLYYIFIGLRWFFLIERRGLEIIIDASELKQF